MNSSALCRHRLFAVLCSLAFFCCARAGEKELRQIGVARIDITPAYPIRLCGYAVRKKESEGVAQHLWAKAMAIGSDKEGPALLITVDNTGVPASIRNEVVRRLQARKGIEPSRVALCSSHSHTSPCLAGNLPTLFGEPLPPEHQAHVEQYTRELVDALEKVALAALADRRPARLSWGQGKAGFAANRRTAGGPVDHDLPVLVVTDGQGKIRAVLANYACHCTTLGGETNQICGDWAGYAQEYLERDHPGTIVLAAIGCGADANPQPRGSIELAQQHGQEVASAVNEVLAHTLTPIRGRLECRTKPIELPFDTLPTREEWEKKTEPTNQVYLRYYAQVNLAKLDRGESLPAKLPYLVQSWNFGGDLAMVFLPGEVVVDYSLRLKKEFDAARLWINAYANDVPCYIPSERILREGGYEGGGAMIYYDKPARLAPGIEDLIIGAVHSRLPGTFLMDEKKAEFPPPKSPQESLGAMQTKAGLEIELAAAEPLVVDPVAIDWGADGKLWVVEMRDYPTGMDGNWKPGSRIKCLEATHGDWKYDKATVFLDNLPFATGVMAWRNGILVCTAPDILYAEDTTGAGRADVVKKVFTGFVTENYQARVNSLSLGLDNWIYGANGLLGGVIHGTAGGKEIDIRGRDFRMHPDSGEFEPASGLTQQGRVRDDWGNWFGCDNSTIAWHYPLPDHYLRRNPDVTAPSPRVSIASDLNPNLLHPISRTLERFNDPQSANHVTSGCGLGIYRDNLLGEEFYGNAFLCEPVHNLVHRLVLNPMGATFAGLRAADEGYSEFLASRDNWFRPVQVRTGPDGALWVVDMYRFVIEHPRWIPPERLAKLDVRAGADKGRIYRIVPKAARVRPIRDLTRMSSAQLAAALDSPNGTERDRIHQELLRRQAEAGRSAESPRSTRLGESQSGRFPASDPRTIASLEELAGKSKWPAARLQALCVLDGLNSLKPKFIGRALADGQAAVRANAIRLSERSIKPPEPNEKADDKSALEVGLFKLVTDPDASVRLQLAFTLGDCDGRRAGEVLGELAKDMADSWLRAAILSSARRHPAEILRSVLGADSKKVGRSDMIGQLIATVLGGDDSQSLAEIIGAITPADGQQLEVWHLTALSSLLDALERKKLTLTALATNADPRISGAVGRLDPVFEWARFLVKDPDTKASSREPAIRLVGRNAERDAEDLQLLGEALNSGWSASNQPVVLDTLKRVRSPGVPGLLLAGWNLRAPSMRQAIVEVLLSRDDWVKELLAALEDGTIGLKEISPANRQRLLKHPTGQQRAQAIWGSDAPGGRADVLAKYQSVTTLAGNPAQGATVFGNLCASCHFLRGQGHQVGPDLGALADKTPADFITAILDPNAAVEPRFIAYNIETKDGRSLSGVVSAETATTLTLMQGGGLEEKILRRDIEAIRASGLSLMPEGLEQNLKPEDLADLIAYLKQSAHSP